MALVKAGGTVLYRSVFDAVRDLLHDEAFEGHDKVMAKYLTPDLLILDDMGMKQLPKRSGEYLFEIIMRRHQLKSTMMTSNRPLQDWGKLVGDVPAATAILDRLLSGAQIVEITGKSYRPRPSRRRERLISLGLDRRGSADPRAKLQNRPQAPTRKPGRSQGQPRSLPLATYAGNNNNSAMFTKSFTCRF